MSHSILKVDAPGCDINIQGKNPNLYYKWNDHGGVEIFRKGKTKMQRIRELEEENRRLKRQMGGNK